MTSCNISLSRDRSATIFFSRAFSCSSALNRFISDGMSPAYFFFQLKNAGELMPAFRQTSATGVPSSAYLMMNAFCASVNFDAFMRFRSSPSQGNLAKTLTRIEGALGSTSVGEQANL